MAHLDPNLERDVQAIELLAKQGKSSEIRQRCKSIERGLFASNIPPDSETLKFLTSRMIEAFDTYHTYKTTHVWDRVMGWLTGYKEREDTEEALALAMCKLMVHKALAAKEKIPIEAFVPLLSDATGFPLQAFDKLSEEKLRHFTPVIEALAKGENTKNDVSLSIQRNFAKFSRTVFTTLPRSLSLLLQDDGTLEFEPTMHKAPKTKGAFKHVKLGAESGRARGKLLELGESATPRIQKERLVQQRIKKFAPAQSSSFVWSIIVSHKSRSKNDAGIFVTKFFSPIMNRGTFKDALTSIIRNRQGLSVIRQIATGIDAMHRSNIAHLDLHGKNILIHKDNHKFVAKIADFDKAEETNKKGLVDFEVPEIDRDDLTLYPHIPPEARSTLVKNSDLKPCDIYALGDLILSICDHPNFNEPYEEALRALGESMRISDPKLRPTSAQVLARLAVIEQTYPG